MNIFATDRCPIISACNLDNRRLIKMVLESAQLLSASIFIHTNMIYNDIYKPTHLKHPCTIWTSLNISNWEWVYNHLQALCTEYNYRFSKFHKTATLLIPLSRLSHHLPLGTISAFVNCTKSKPLMVDFTHIQDVHFAYKQYLLAKWRHDKIKPLWTKRNPPNWADFSN